LSIESPSSVEVDICDDEILQLWNESYWSLKKNDSYLELANVCVKEYW
jgi:hypothetical protein